MKQITLCFFHRQSCLGGMWRVYRIAEGARQGQSTKTRYLLWTELYQTHHFTTKVEKQRIKDPTFDFNGTLLSPAAYQTVAVDHITEKKQTVSFRAICENDLTAKFIRGLQQGLSASGFFDDRITGSMDTKTRRAIKAFQLEQGILSDWPCWETARMLGLEPL